MFLKPDRMGKIQSITSESRKNILIWVSKMQRKKKHTGFLEPESNLKISLASRIRSDCRGSWMPCLEVWTVWECWSMWVGTSSREYQTYHTVNELPCVLVRFRDEIKCLLLQSCVLNGSPLPFLSFTMSGFIWMSLWIVVMAVEERVVINDLWGLFWCWDSDFVMSRAVFSVRYAGILALWAYRGE